jgi:hypothetical protein
MASNEQENNRNPPNNNLLAKENSIKDKFMFVFEPFNLAYDCCCGCSLRTGVQIISILFIAGSVSNFLTALKMTSTIDLFLSGLFFVLYLIAGTCVLYSTISLNHVYALTGYYIFAMIFIFNLIDNIVVFFLIILGAYYYEIIPNEDIPIIALIYFLACAVILSIHLYMIWVVFSFSIHLKHGRSAIIAGEIHFMYQQNPYNPVSASQPLSNTNPPNNAQQIA